MLTLLSSFTFSFPAMPFSQQSLSSFSIFINVSTVETCGCLFYQVVFFFFKFNFIGENLMSTGNGFRGKELNHFFFKNSCTLACKTVASRGNRLLTTVDVYQQQECHCLAGTFWANYNFVLLSFFPLHGCFEPQTSTSRCLCLF